MYVNERKLEGKVCQFSVRKRESKNIFHLLLHQEPAEAEGDDDSLIVFSLLYLD
jgi:hypothetical protein